MPAGVALGFPHHGMQRGNHRQPVFEEDEDFAQYKSRGRMITRGLQPFKSILWLAAHVVKLVS